jgi:NUMOD3 motif
VSVEDVKKALIDTVAPPTRTPLTGGGKYYVYEHWRLDINECFYVGKGHGDRAYKKQKRNKLHVAIVDKLAREGSAYDVRIAVLNLSEEDAFRIERERIAFWRNDGADLANLTSGGQGQSGYSPTAETRRKLSELNKGKPSPFRGRKHKPETIAIFVEKAKKRGPPEQTPEVKKKIVAFHTGRRRSDATRERISQSLKGKSNWAKGKPSKLKGRTLSDKTKEKMSAAAKKKWKRQKQSGWVNPNVGGTCSDDTKAKMRESSKKRFLRKDVPRRNAKGIFTRS